MELIHKIEVLDRANSDLSNLFQSTEIATVFLDRDLLIRSFTPAVTKIFNLIPSDHGRPLTDIVNRIDYQGLEADVRAVFAGGEAIEKSIRPSGGENHYLVHLLPYRGQDQAIDGVVVTFVDVTNIVSAEGGKARRAAPAGFAARSTRPRVRG
jgi:two-component system, chemotaxis family, CheB/CheR fusion protein